jgi:hypothetical protein
MTTYRFMDGSGSPTRPGSGPASAVSYGSPGSPLPYIAGNQFCVTEGGLWFEGYWWWVCSSGQDTTAVKCALWQLSTASTGVIVPGSIVTSGTLTAGQWNYVPLATPVPLAPSATQSYGAVYNAAIGYSASHGFPATKNQFGNGDPYSAGITNGPLFCCASDFSGAPSPGSAFSWTKPQMPYSTAGSDPSVNMPGTNDADDNLWVDVQISDTAPAGATYKGFSSAPVFVVPGVSAQSLAYTLGLEFTVAEACPLVRIWHYSPSGVTILPSRCGVWNVSTQAEVAGTDNQAPVWSGAAGSGWVSCDYTSSGVTLQSGVSYKVSTFTSNNSQTWFLASASWWGGSPGPFSSGLTNGPLTILGNSAASPGQDSWNVGTSWTYPATSTNPEYDGVDVEVMASSATQGTATLTGTGSLAAPGELLSQVALAGVGVLAVPSAAELAGAVLSGAGALLAPVSISAGATLSGAGAITATGHTGPTVSPVFTAGMGTMPWSASTF